MAYFVALFGVTHSFPYSVFSLSSAFSFVYTFIVVQCYYKREREGEKGGESVASEFTVSILSWGEGGRQLINATRLE